MRLSLSPEESADLRLTGGIDPAAIVFFEGINQNYRLVVVETAKRGYHWAILGPVGVYSMQERPAPMMITAIMAGRQAVLDYKADQEGEQ